MDHIFINHDTNLLDVTLAPQASTEATVASQDDAVSPKQARAALASHGLRAPPTETLHTTTEHPFLTTDRGFVNAQDLHLGEPVQRLDGSVGVVVAVVSTPGDAVRYNLTVHELHTYAVGDGLWVVHNCGGDINSSPQQYAHERAGELQNALPEGSRGRVTMGVGIAEDENGIRRVIIGTSEPNGYLRPGVRSLIGDSDIVASGISHAERNILAEIDQRGWTAIAVGAGRDICEVCEAAIVAHAGQDAIATPTRSGFAPFWMGGST